MKTIIALEIETQRKVNFLAEIVAQRAYTLSGVENVRVLAETPMIEEGGVAELERREPIV